MCKILPFQRQRAPRQKKPDFQAVSDDVSKQNPASLCSASHMSAARVVGH